MVIRWSLRWQLTAWYVTAMLIIVTLFGGVTIVKIRSHLHARIDAELAEEANELAEELLFAKSTEDFRSRFQRQYSEHGGFSFQVSRFDGSVVLGSPWLLAHELPRPVDPRDHSNPILQDVSFAQLGLQRVLCRTIRGPEEPLLIHVLTPHSQTERELTQFAELLLAGGLLSILLACLGGWWIARRAMSPIDRMARAAEHISAENLGETIPIANPHDELGRLASTLNQTFRRLRSSMEEMRRFSADAAHELRTPLAVMRTELEVTLRSDPSPARLLQGTEIALAEATRLSMIVDQLLALSRQDAGLQLPEMEEVYIAPLMQDVIESIAPIAQRKQMELLRGPIPESIVFGDDVMLSRVFFNLLDNAIKFTPPGGTVRLSGERSVGTMRISVMDSGIGIDACHLPHVFDRFFRVDESRNPQAEGAGLGLAICKSIVEAHGGTITATSEPGRGSCFTVALPTRNAVDQTAKLVPAVLK